MGGGRVIIGVVIGRDGEHGVPVFRGGAARRALVALYGLPNAAPSIEELAVRPVMAVLHTPRSLFVDDDQDGRPMAVWVRGV